MVMAGMFNNRVSKKGERYTPEDMASSCGQPQTAPTRRFQKILQAKIAKTYPATLANITNAKTRRAATRAHKPARCSCPVR